CEAIDTAELRCGSNIASSQGLADLVEFIGVIEGEVRRPVFVADDQLDVNLGDKLAFSQKFGARFLYHCSFCSRSKTGSCTSSRWPWKPARSWLSQRRA